MTASSALRLLAAAAVVAVVAAPAGLHAGAHDTYPIGPAVGVAIPHDLSAKDQAGRERDFASLVRARGLVILFNRSLDW